MSEIDEDPNVTLKQSELAEMLKECTSSACSEAVKAAFEQFAIAVETGKVTGSETKVEEILAKVASSARQMAKGFENLVITGPSGEPL